MKKRSVKGKVLTDYSKYSMSMTESILSLVLGAAGGAAAGGIFFGIPVLSILTGAAGAAAGIRAGNRYFRRKRDRLMMMQFRDFLESVSASLSAGRNISSAVSDAGIDMQVQYGADSVIAREAMIISAGIKNGSTAEIMFADFGKRSAQHDIKCFADTFAVCNRTGGNMKQVIAGAHRMISDKMQMINEIEAIAAKGKNDLKIMTCMPFVILPLLGMLSGPGDASGLTVRAVGAVLIAAAYISGNRIADIKI